MGLDIDNDRYNKALTNTNSVLQDLTLEKNIAALPVPNAIPETSIVRLASVLLAVSFWVKSTKGSVVNESPSIRIDGALSPLLDYGKKIYPLASKLGLIYSFAGSDLVVCHINDESWNSERSTESKAPFAQGG